MLSIKPFAKKFVSNIVYYICYCLAYKTIYLCDIFILMSTIITILFKINVAHMQDNSKGKRYLQGNYQ